MSGEFIHLRARSAYSLAEGAIKLKALVDLAVADQMPALGLTDHGNLFGALEFAVTAAKAGVQPIVGCTLRIAPEGPKRSGPRAPLPTTLALFAQTEVGWRNLMTLSSQVFRDPDFSVDRALPLSLILDHADGLLATTGGAGGPVGAALAQGDDGKAKAALDRLAGAFGDRLYVEIQRHSAPAEAATEAGLIAMADAAGLPLLATNDCFFAGGDMHLAHDALICIGASRYVSETDRARMTPQQRFRPATEMVDAFADLPDAVANSVDFARRIGFMPTTREPILPHFPTEAGRSEAEELRAQAAAGLEDRIAAQVTPAGLDTAPYRDRLYYELGVIESMGFPGYFLIVAEFIQWAKGEGIPVGPGRGSGAGSVVAWALKITDLDPLRFGLLFERFLNPDRVSMPDFDVDFCQERRDEVIRHVRE
ncbi:MAG: PHP domain-containing protein, partial [Pseudomonadota bacterium]